MEFESTLTVGIVISSIVTTGIIAITAYYSILKSSDAETLEDVTNKVF